MRLKNCIENYFGQIKAGPKLKGNIKSYLAAKTGNFSAGAKYKYHNAPLKLCAMALVVFVLGTAAFFVPTAEIGFDINPAIELLVNNFNTVVYAKGLNPDGDKLVGSLDLRFKNYETAFDEIVSDSTIKALLDNNETLSVTVSGINDGQTKRIYDTIENCPGAGVGVRCQYITAEEYRAAHKAGLTCGRYRAFLYLKELGYDISADEIKNMTMGGIQKLIRELSGASADGSDVPFCLRRRGA